MSYELQTPYMTPLTLARTGCGSTVLNTGLYLEYGYLEGKVREVLWSFPPRSQAFSSLEGWFHVKLLKTTALLILTEKSNNCQLESGPM